MKARGILFSAPMARANLDGSKTQTRRTCKGARELSRAADWQIDTCPYGKVGDQLWQRETWSKAKSCNCSDIFYRADGETSGKQTAMSFIEREKRWRPSIHMPRWASRATFEITEVRVQRLHDITTEDAEAEGWPGPDERNSIASAYPIAWYAALWDSINGRGTYDANPWVWAITYKRVKP